jgi:CheY-like chemotaxis protein
MNETTGELSYVLVVDDDPGVRVLLRLMLLGLGYTALPAAGGHEAVQLLRDRPGPVSLVLMDVQMPGGDGPATLAALRQIDPHLACCFMTGDSGRYTEAELLGFGALTVLYKPFTKDDLAGVLSGAAATGARPPA